MPRRCLPAARARAHPRRARGGGGRSRAASASSSRVLTLRRRPPRRRRRPRPPSGCRTSGRSCVRRRRGRHRGDRRDRAGTGRTPGAAARRSWRRRAGRRRRGGRRPGARPDPRAGTGESQGAVTTKGCCARRSPAWSPAGGPAKPPMSSPNTGWPKACQAGRFWLALMSSASTWGRALERVPPSAARRARPGPVPPPMRLPWPPASRIPVMRRSAGRGLGREAWWELVVRGRGGAQSRSKRSAPENSR